MRPRPTHWVPVVTALVVHCLTGGSTSLAAGGWRFETRYGEKNDGESFLDRLVTVAFDPTHMYLSAGDLTYYVFDRSGGYVGTAPRCPFSIEALRKQDKSCRDIDVLRTRNGNWAWLISRGPILRPDSYWFQEATSDGQLVSQWQVPSPPKLCAARLFSHASGDYSIYYSGSPGLLSRFSGDGQYRASTPVMVQQPQDSLMGWDDAFYSVVRRAHSTGGVSRTSFDLTSGSAILEPGAGVAGDWQLIGVDAQGTIYTTFPYRGTACVRACSREGVVLNEMQLESRMDLRAVDEQGNLYLRRCFLPPDDRVFIEKYVQAN